MKFVTEEAAGEPGVTPNSYLGNKSGNFHLNNENNQLKN